MNTAPATVRHWWPVVLVVVLLQALSRYAAAPVCDFTLDDWAYSQMARGQTWDQALGAALKDPDRPVAAAMVTLIFSVFDEQLAGYALIGLLSHSIFLGALVVLAGRISGRADAALITGIVFALLPNLTESFSWPTLNAYAPGVALYPLAALAFLDHLQRRYRGAGLLCALGLALALGNYEIGIGLPGALFVLMLLERERPGVRTLWPLAMGPALYLAWRFTDGFGLAQGLLFPPRQFAPTWAALVWNTSELASWWLGRHFWSSLAQGYQGFLLAGSGGLRGLLLVNGVAALGLWLAGRWCTRNAAPAEPLSGRAKLLLLGLAWFACAVVLQTVSWTTGRLNYLPGAGLALAVGGGLAMVDPRRWRGALALLALLWLPANQGTALQWRESGRLLRDLYQRVEREAPQWASARVVLFDTTSLRQRLASHLRPETANGLAAVAYYGNAGLLRGFVPRAMMERVRPDHQAEPLLDTEAGARQEGGELVWHPHHAEGDVHRTPLVDVYRIEVVSTARAFPP